MDPHRLLILTPSHSVTGGVERIIEALAKGLPSSGLEVTVGLARGARFNDPARFRAAFPQLRTVEISSPTGTGAGRRHGVSAVLKAVRPDVVLVARLFDAYDAVARMKQSGSGPHLAVTIDAYEPEYIVDLAAYAPFVDLCVTSGRLIARAVEHFTSLPADRVVSIPAGVRAATRVVDHSDRRPLRLGYVGRLEQGQKRVLDLPDTLAFIDQMAVPWSCVVTGAGPAEEDLRRALAGKGLSGRVRLQGWCSLDELRETVYPEIDVLLHFSAFEGITIAPREAMAHGAVPVISRFVGCRTEGQFLHGRNALTFPVGDTRAAAEAVRTLHLDRALLRRLSEGARLSQSGTGSEEAAVEAWAAALRDAVAAQQRCGSASPPMPAPTGRLARWGVPVTVAEALRRWARVRFPHRTPGAEWPHWSGHADPQTLATIWDFALKQEAVGGPPNSA